MELWGGIECTLNRVGGKRFDQLTRSGHYERGDDLERIRSLGITTLRYPLLWEQAATATPGEYDWSFADDRVAELRRLGMRPIVGLVHHGCGPEYTHLADRSFAPGLADYALQLARRHPELEWYTPVNEPLTTARFSGLYGFWQPHGRSNQAFARILVNECRATVLAMRAIRTVNSAARLVQTDDLGTIYSTPHLGYQAHFENERRWLAWDLLCGYVSHTHPMYSYLVGWGITPRELGWLVDNPCPPAIIGIDHYVTSDRFLDENLERYPASSAGGNGRERYADVEAVRVLERPGTSLSEVVRAASTRYGAPISLTEVHIGAGEHDQVRWLHRAIAVCKQLAEEGVDVRAVTAWALLGSFDWDTLLTRGGDTYEPGAFCLRSGTPRLTVLGEYVAAIGNSRERPAWCSEILSTDGWWGRPERLLYGAARGTTPLATALSRARMARS